SGRTGAEHGDGLQDAQRDVVQLVEALRGNALERRGGAKRLVFAFRPGRKLDEDVRIAAAARDTPFGERLVPGAMRASDDALDERATCRIIERFEAHHAGAHVLGTVELAGDVRLPGCEDDECAALERPPGQSADARPRGGV